MADSRNQEPQINKQLYSDPHLWADAVINGDVLAASRLMRNLDDQVLSAKYVMMRLFQHMGNAHIIGVTGPPGTGKSTLVDQLIEVARSQNHTVGIVAVDPTSPFTRGAILGDRIRMKRHCTDPGVFIRSVATRGHLGGLSRSAQDITDVMDAMGKDLIFVETVGVGQNEMDIVSLAHTNVVVQVPGMGDEIQSMKAGIFEIGDIFVVNKADLDGADKTLRDLEIMLHLKDLNPGTWKPIVLKTQANTANTGKYITELMTQIEKHGEYVRKNHWEEKQKSRIYEKFIMIVRESLLTQAEALLGKNNFWQNIIGQLEKKLIDPYSAAEKVVKELLIDDKT
jgi:LAO/AO transport system kinase